jgi:alpha-galactosidase
MRQLLVFLLIYISFPAVSCQINDSFSAERCSVTLKNDTLTIENSQIKRTWLWNNGNLITLSLENKKGKFRWDTTNKQTDLYLPFEKQMASNGEIKSEFIPDSYQSVKHVRTTILYDLGDLQIRKIVKIYPDSHAIATELFYKGIAAKNWVNTLTNAADEKNIETVRRSSDATKCPAWNS